MTATKTEPATGMVVRATALASVLLVLGTALGLVRDLLLARFFGATAQTDAFLVAWTVPETASPLLIEGAMAFLMVPIFVRALATRGSLRDAVATTLPRIVLPLALSAALIALAAPVLVRLLAPGLADPALATQSMRVTAVTVLMFGIAGYVAAALRSTHVFGWPAAIYIAYNVGILGAMVLLHEQIGVLSAAIGVALGSVLMVVVQAPAFLRRLAPTERLGRLDLPRIGLLAFVPIAVYTLTRHAQVFVERILGSQLSAGTISQLNYAQKVAQVPMMLSVVMATVTFPMLARSIVTGDEAGSRERLRRDLQAVGAMVLVATAFLVAYAEPLVRLLFEHGAFTRADTTTTAHIMRVYALGLLGQALTVVFARSYFSHGRSIWYPAVAMAPGLAATVLVSVVLIGRWHAVAIAAGNAAGITLTAGLLLAGVRERATAVSVRAVLGSVARLAVMAGGAAAVGWLAGQLILDQPPMVQLIAGGLVVVVAFILIGLALGAEETRPLARLVRRMGAPGVPPVFMYHSVGGRDDHDPYRITVSPTRFAKQMAWLARRGLRGAATRELLDAADRGRAARLVGLTFDDGYADFATEVVPVLTRRGFTATVFVVAGNVGGHNDWDSDGRPRRLMSADDIRAVGQAGMEIGSHGYRHRHLSEVDTETLDAEIVHSRDTLARMYGAPPAGFCYPYGEFSEPALAAVRAAGYDYAVATRQSGRRDRHALPRIYVGESDGPLRLRAKLLRHRLIWGAGG